MRAWIWIALRLAAAPLMLIGILLALRPDLAAGEGPKPWVVPCGWFLCVLGLLIGVPFSLLLRHCRTCGRRLNPLDSSRDPLCPACRTNFGL